MNVEMHVLGLERTYVWFVLDLKVAIEGKVIQRAECRPFQNDASYMQLKKYADWSQNY